MKSDKLNDELFSKIESFVSDLVQKNHRPANEIILDDVELRDLLKISRRTALKYRSSGRLKNYKVDNKIYYFLADILEFIRSVGGANA